MPKPLTNAASVAAAKPRNGHDTEYRVSGVKGFILRVRTSGHATFWFYYSRTLADGKRKLRKVRIGDRDAFTLADARQAAAELFARTERGEDPATDGAAKAGAITFAELWERRSREDQRLAPKTVKQNTETLAKHVFPAIGTFPANAVTREDIRRIVDTVAAAGNLRQADNVKTTVSATYKWGIANHLVADNPATSIPSRWTYIPKERVLSEGEMRAFLAALGSAKAGIGEDTRDILLTALLTLCRREEVCAAQCAEIDAGRALWTLPGDTTARGRRIKGRTKNGVPHVVPLSTQALTIFERSMKRNGGAYVFPACTTRVKIGKAPNVPHIAPDSVNGALDEVIERFALPPFTPHDLRRTAATWMGEQGIADSIIERSLNHVPDTRNITRKSYNHSQLVEERRKALQLWADHVLPG